MMSSRMCLTVMILMAGAGPALAADLFVAPDGKPAHDGTAARPLDIHTALGKSSPARPGDTIYLGGGVYQPPRDGDKPLPFEWAVSGTAERPVIVRPAPGAHVHLNGGAALTGSHVQYHELEVGSLEWTLDNDATLPEALQVTDGQDAKVINCNLFGGRQGTTMWSEATNTELYGCLVHDFGFFSENGDRGQGHAYYTQNETGVKTIEHNIAYRGAGWNVHIYGQRGTLEGYDVIENIFYIAGAAVPNQTNDNILVAGYSGADRIRLLGNVCYQPSTAIPYRPNVRMSHYKEAVNGTGEVRDNYFAGAPFGLSIGEWQKLDVTGNTIWAGRVLIEINSNPTGSGNRPRDHKPDPSHYNLRNNTYVLPGGDGHAFRYANREAVTQGELLTLAQWQQLGFDHGSTTAPSRDGKPTGTRIFLYPNKYAKGRGHLGIFNWDGLDHVKVDLSAVLERGQAYAIYNCLDIRQTIAAARPVLSGTYEGGEVAIPMKKDPISPDFDAFLILPRP